MALFNIRHRRPGPTAPVLQDPLADSTPTEEKALTKQESHRLFMDLPTEIHLIISELLIYPDALSLKHVNRHLFNIVDTGIKIKVEWLVLRRSLHLKCPNDQKCDLGSDLRFCRGSVPMLIRQYRNHIECESRPEMGCVIYNTKICFHRRKPSHRIKQWLWTVLHRDSLRLIIGAVVLLACWVMRMFGVPVGGSLLSWSWWMLPLSVTCVTILAIDTLRLAIYRRRGGVIREW